MPPFEELGMPSEDPTDLLNPPSSDLPSYMPSYPRNEHESELNLPPDTDAIDPESLFNLFMPDQILQQRATNTNKYAASQRALKGVTKGKRA
ncbi:hypothetical protein LTR66_010551 [Elasticomyces elasticus]|nr:hypothetical protein LTR66_010551 [Elasticomyces elasticus]